MAAPFFMSQSVRLCLSWSAAFVFGAFISLAQGAESQAVKHFKKDIEPILKERCYDCHGDGENKGNVSFDGFKSVDELVGKTDLWQAALKSLRAGLMPPAKKPRLPAEELKRIEQWVKLDALGIDPKNPDPGRVTIRRLNRVEYHNTIRDLMDVDFNSEVEFPPDDTGQGFDNIGEVLTVSPLLMEKYVQAASAIVAQAVPTQPKVLPEQVLISRPTRGSRGSDSTLLSFYEDGKRTRSFTAKHEGKYKVLLSLEVRGQFNFDPGRAKVAFNVDGAKQLEQEFGWQEGKSHDYEYELDWKEGNHELTVTLQPLVPLEKKVNSIELRVASLRVQGPMDEKYWNKPDNYDRFFPKGPASESTAARDQYARELLRDFATRAFRRPVDETMVEKLAGLAKGTYSRSGSTFEQGISRAMTAVLASPRFLYRVEASGEKRKGETYPLVDEYSLASRLSYFFWSTMPDEELVRLAAKGELRKNLSTQVRRLFEDSRSKSLVRNFTGQWLQARDVETVPINMRAVTGFNLGRRPDGSRYEFDSDLRRAMRTETEMFFAHIMKEDRSVLEMIDSDYTFLNESLARHYGLTNLNVRGQEMRLVKLPEESPRGGLLTQGTVLTVTSNPTRTSPVKRGLFILDNILGTPPPPPDANVPDLDVAFKEFKDRQPSLREALELHRGKPLCNSCHNRMDPLGLALENFNALGQWRENEVPPPPPRDFRNFNRQQAPPPEDTSPKIGPPIDAAGKLVTGEEFTGVRELKKILKEKHATDFYRCLTEKLLIYALGRGLEPYDTETVDRIVERLQREDGRFSALLMGVIESAPFQKQRELRAKN
jgi:hypothetical protein